MKLPECSTLLVERREHALYVTLNRPDSRNAMSLAMVGELREIFAAVAADKGHEVRAIVLRGAGGHFCSGGDVKDMAGAAAPGDGNSDPWFELNRAFGRMLTMVRESPALVVAVLEGTVMGGGFGLACISDVAIAAEDARFALPETSLGLIPAQIAPFVVERIGLTRARRIMLLGLRLDGREALAEGIVHEVCPGGELAARLDAVLQQVRRCAPAANAATKRLALAVGHKPMEELLDEAARDFSAAVRGPEGSEGTLAFIQKRQPVWMQQKG